jgi:hypothetical protein
MGVTMEALKGPWTLEEVSPKFYSGHRHLFVHLADETGSPIRGESHSHRKENDKYYLDISGTLVEVSFYIYSKVLVGLEILDKYQDALDFG